MSTRAQEARQQKDVSHIIVLTHGEAEATIAALETALLNQEVKRRGAVSVRRDWQRVIAKIKREQRGGE